MTVVKKSRKTALSLNSFENLQRAAINCVMNAESEKAVTIVEKLKKSPISIEQYHILFAEVFLLAARGLSLTPDANRLLEAFVDMDAGGMADDVFRLFGQKLIIKQVEDFDDYEPAKPARQPAPQQARQLVQQQAQAPASNDGIVGHAVTEPGQPLEGRPSLTVTRDEDDNIHIDVSAGDSGNSAEGWV